METEEKNPLVPTKAAVEIIRWFDGKIAPIAVDQAQVAALKTDLFVLLGLARTAKSAKEADEIRQSGYLYAIKYPCECPDRFRT